MNMPLQRTPEPTGRVPIWMPKTPPGATGAASDVSADDSDALPEGVAAAVQACTRELMKLAAQSGTADGSASTTTAGATTTGSPAQTSTASQTENTRLETMAILGRHEDKFKKAMGEKGLDKLLADKSTPDDLRRAIRNLQADPEMMDALDAAKNGKHDHKISAEDINKLQANSANRAYAESKAEDYTQDYVPSDCTDTDAQPRSITENDAQRELFRYSDYLPKHVSRESLQKIVDGTAAQGKAPPQLVAAAKYYVDHPEAWSRATGKSADGAIRRDGLCNRFAKSMELTADETHSLQVLDQNRDVFFGSGSLTKDKLRKIANDSSQSDDVRHTAQSLADAKGSLLFTMLDNGKHGHGGNAFNAADDHKIGRGDLDRVLQKHNTTVAPAEQHAPAGSTYLTSERAAEAAEDMAEGQQDQPPEKKKKGGQLRDIANFFLKAYSAVMHVASSVLGALAKIPGLGLLAAPASLAAEGLAGAASVGSAALEGKDTKQALVNAGIGMGGAALGLVVPGGGKLVGEGAKAATQEATRQAAKAGAKSAAGEVAKTAAEQSGLTDPDRVGSPLQGPHAPT